MITDTLKTMLWLPASGISTYSMNAYDTSGIQCDGTFNLNVSSNGMMMFLNTSSYRCGSYAVQNWPSFANYPQKCWDIYPGSFSGVLTNDTIPAEDSSTKLTHIITTGTAQNYKVILESSWGNFTTEDIQVSCQYLVGNAFYSTSETNGRIFLFDHTVFSSPKIVKPNTCITLRVIFNYNID